MAEALTGVNGSIIKWAREYYNMSPIDAACSIGIDLERYKKWEEGTEFPTYAKLKQISAVFHKPCAIFFFPTPPELPSIKGDLRTLSSSIVDTLSKNVVLQFEKAKSYAKIRDAYPLFLSMLCLCIPLLHYSRYAWQIRNTLLIVLRLIVPFESGN